MIKLIRRKNAAAQIGWHEQHLWKVATDPAYEHLNFPKPVRIGKNSVAFVQHELDEWVEDRIRERNTQGFKPKPVNPRENARRAKERATADQ